MKKILIIRFSSIGDIILTTALVRCLKNQNPEIDLHYLTRKSFAPLLSANPYINKLITINSDLSEVSDQLRQEKYDHIIDLHKNLRSKSVLLTLRRPSSTFNKLNKKKWLLVNFKINLLPSVHIVDRYMKAAAFLNLKNDERGLDLFIAADDEIELNSIPVEFHDGYLGVAVGAKHFTKQIPLEKIVEIINLAKKPAILLGDSNDRAKAEEVVGLCKFPVYNACGRYGIAGSASLVRQAKVMLSGDTGLMHIAAAFRRPLISIWGNTIPAFGMFPYFPSDLDYLSEISEVNHLSCRPCSKLGFRQCPRGHFNCMMQTDVDKAVTAICKFWDLNFPVMDAVTNDKINSGKN